MADIQANQWMEDFLVQSPSMAVNIEYPKLLDPLDDALFESDDIFSHNSSCILTVSSTVSSTPPLDVGSKMPANFMSTVSSKLEQLQGADFEPENYDFGVPAEADDSDGSMCRKNKRKLTASQKVAHNRVEKKYRVNINSKIHALQTVIPWLDDVPQSRINKLVVLEKAFEYICYLREQTECVLVKQEE